MMFICIRRCKVRKRAYDEVNYPPGGVPQVKTPRNATPRDEEKQQPVD